MRGTRGKLVRARGRLAAVAMLVAACAMCGRAMAQGEVKEESASEKSEGAKSDGAKAREKIRAYRGTAGSIEVEHAGAALRAKAAEPNAPVLVRVRALARAGFYTIEYLGLRTGEFDLASLVERVDGRPAELGSIPIRFESRLPASAGTDVFGQRAAELNVRVWYREGLIALAAAWLLAPVIVIVRRRLARKPVAQAEDAAPEPTTMERLRAILNEAKSRELSVDERARMELLLLRAMREATPGEKSARELAAALSELRRGEVTGEVVRAVEAWTHAERDGSRESAVEAAGRVARARDVKVVVANGTPGRVGGGA